MKNYFTKLFSVLFLLAYFISAAGAQTLIMNEVSNGPAGNQEYVEFVVVSNTVVYDCGSSTPPCIDLRGWIVDDNSGYHGTSGVATGAVRFSSASTWSCVPVGTIILVYNNLDRNPAIPADDLSLSDGNCRIIAPINSTLFESNGTTPGAVACSYPSSAWTSGGNWNNTVLANAGDCARIVNLAGCEVFSVCWGSDNLNNLIYFAGSASQKVYYFNNGDPMLQSNWSSGTTTPSPGLQTPGAPNNGANASYIAQFNNNCVPLTPVSVTATSVNAGCTCNGSATASATGSIGGYTYIWYDAAYNPIGQTTATATALCAGTYHVIGRSSIGCTDTATVTLTSTSTTTVTATSAAICQGQTASLNSTPSATGGTYIWMPGGQTTQSISVSPATTTTYTITYTLAGCSGTATSTVTVTPLPVMSVNNASICSGQTATLTASGSTLYAWNTGSGANPLNVSPTTTTTYTVTGTTAGCSASATATVTVTPLPVITATNATVCAGQSASVTASGGSTYVWDSGSTANPLTVSPASTTTYTVTGTSAGCAATATSTVTVTPLPVITVNTAVICAGETAHLVASGADAFTWSAGATATGMNTADANPSATTTYTVTGTTAGCSGSSTATVTVNPLPVMSVNNATICSGQTATLTASGSTLYAWNTGSGANPFNISPTTTTTYTVTGTTAGCSASATATVTVTPLPVITATNATVCAGQSVSVTASGGSTYVWDSGSTANPLTVSPASTSTYTVTGTSAGCAATATSTVTVTPLPVLIVSSPVICAGETANLVASGADAFTWSAGATSTGINTAEATPAATTTYTVTGTTAGCSGSSTATVTVNPLPVITVNNAAVCAGASATLTASGGSTYVWDTGSTANPLSVSPATTTTYTVTGTEASSGCSASATAAVTVNPTPVVAVNSETICPGSSATLTATGAAGYVWSGAETTASIIVTPALTTTYTVTGTTAGCSSSATATVTVHTITPVSAGTDVSICTGGNVQLAAAPTGAGFSYRWSPVATLSDATISNPFASPAVTTLYTVVVTDAIGCTGSASVTVAVNPPLTVIPEVAATVCPGSSVVISATPVAGAGSGYTYSWSPAASLDNASLQSPQATPAVTTTYTVTVTDLCASTATATETVTLLPLPVTVFESDLQAGCAPLCVQFADTAGVTPGSITAWSWNFGDGQTDVSQNPLHCFRSDGLFSIALTITDANGCSNTITQTNYIDVLPAPDAAFTSTSAQATVFDPQLSFVNQTTNATSYVWNFGDNATSTQLNPNHAYAGAGTYPVWLVASNSNGCVDSVLHEVVIQGEFAFYAPNAITPNGNSLNDVFLPKGMGWDPASYQLLIYDRWGNKCFETKDISKGWDGTVKGKEPVQMDVYVWRVNVMDIFGEGHAFTGTVTIVK